MSKDLEEVKTRVFSNERALNELKANISESHKVNTALDIFVVILVVAVFFSSVVLAAHSQYP